MDLVDDVDLVARRDRAVAHPVDQIADFGDPAVARRIYFDDIHIAVLGDRPAGLAFAAGLDGGAAPAVGPDAIDRPGENPRRGRLADPAHAGEQIGVGQAPAFDGVGQGAHQHLLADHF